MKLLCLFKMCDWVYIGKGLYQCKNCKVISWGTNGDKKDEEDNDDDEEPFPQQTTWYF